MFQTITSIDLVTKIIATDDVVCLFISQANCSVCHGLQPQIATIIDHYPEITAITVDALQVPEVASVFDVLTVPVVLVFYQGKEYIRRARIVETQQFKASLAKLMDGIST